MPIQSVETMNSRPEFPNLPAESEQTELNDLLVESLAPIELSSGIREVLRTRLMDRIARSVADQAGLLTVRLKDGAWQTLRRGVRFKPLWTGPAGSSVLIEFAPGALLPAHRHSWTEEGIVLRGGLQMGSLDLGPLDYHLSPAGSRHASIRSRQGALAYLRGTSLGRKSSVLRELIGGLLPVTGPAPTTVFADNKEGWVEVAEGVMKKDLCSDGILASRFYRLAPGAKVPAHSHLQDEECMMLEGEVFLGDILLRAGEYQLAPVGTRHGEVFSDVGATLFVRGARDD
ncbi:MULTISPECIES: cupin domain-containing protein [Methylococcus]|nr:MULTISPECIES: cupin domain-containing protein [Methylococcus]